LLKRTLSKRIPAAGQGSYSSNSASALTTAPAGKGNGMTELESGSEARISERTLRNILHVIFAIVFIPVGAFALLIGWQTVSYMPLLGLLLMPFCAASVIYGVKLALY
jgi:hypothetical protein